MLEATPVRDGYGKLAELMSCHDEFAILRRFRHLNMKNLLYLQAEITQLEEELGELADRDARDPALPFHGRDWWSLARGGADADADEDEDAAGGQAQAQWAKVLELRGKLAAYNDAVLQQARLARLDGPSRHELAFLRRWMERPRMGNFPLLGLDRDAWDEAHEDDLVALRARSRDDVFSSWVAETLVPTFHRWVGERFRLERWKKQAPDDPTHPEIFSYDDKTLSTIIFNISIMVASLLSIGSVLLLYYIQSDSVRLGFAMALCAFFAIALGLVTNAKRVDIFSSSVAFAAVIVAFLTNNNDGPCQCQVTVG